MTSIFLNFDTIQGDYINSNNPYDCKYDITPAIRKCKKILLKSVEIPVGFCNIRKDGGSTLSTFSFAVAGTAYTFTLPNKVYTSIQNLVTDLNSSITALNLSNSFTLGVSNYKITITFTASTTITIYQTQLSQYILGFLSQSYTGTTITAPNNYTLNIDNYINLNLSNLPIDSHNNYHGIIQTFKVPLNCTSNVIYFQAENNNFQQYALISDTNFIIERLHMKITDRFGNVINANGLDYSVTLCFETHE